MATGGNYRATSNDDTLDTSRPFLVRPGLARSWSSHHHLLVVNLDLGALARSADPDLDVAARRAAIRTASSTPTTAAAASYWCHAARQAAGVFSTPALDGYALVRKATVDLVLAAAIDVFGMTLDRPSPPTGDTALPAAVRRAVQFIDDNVAAPIGVVEIAQASRMSVRGVQLAFRRVLDTTPTDYLRRSRLSHARAQLIASTTAGTTVADVAREWGFTNASRFSRAYRQAYDESPRSTLEG